MLDEKQVLDLFRSSGAMLEGHFELSSGLHSDRYFQCALILEDPKRAEQLAQALAAKIRARDPKPFDLVIGPALGAVVWAHEMARALGSRCQFTERTDGKMGLRRGFRVEPGERVLVVEDVITTGGSAREVIEVLKSFDVPTVAAATLSRRTASSSRR